MIAPRNDVVADGLCTVTGGPDELPPQAPSVTRPARRTTDQHVLSRRLCIPAIADTTSEANQRFTGPVQDAARTPALSSPARRPSAATPPAGSGASSRQRTKAD